MAKAAVPLISLIFLVNDFAVLYSRYGYLVGSVADNLILFSDILVVLTVITHIASVKYYERKL